MSQFGPGAGGGQYWAPPPPQGMYDPFTPPPKPKSRTCGIASIIVQVIGWFFLVFGFLFVAYFFGTEVENSMVGIIGFAIGLVFAISLGFGLIGGGILFSVVIGWILTGVQLGTGGRSKVGTAALVLSITSTLGAVLLLAGALMLMMS
jgi:hypothetical protein